MRKKIILICEICLERNYNITKNISSSQRFEISKFCSKCNKHTNHKETR